MTEKKGALSGKLPLSKKPRPDWNIQDFSPFGNQVDVPKNLKKLGKEMGIVFRWLAAKDLHANYGYHPKGWKPFKMSDFNMDPDSAGIKDYHLGKDIDGYVRRGTLLLGFKPVEARNIHRDFLKKKADAQMGYEKQKAEELRQKSKEGNLGARIFEGYDENV